MIEQAIAHVWKQAQEANRPQVIQVPGDPAHVHRLVHIDGTVERIENEPRPRRLTVERLEDIIELANNRHRLDRSEADNEDVLRRVVFYNEDEVMLAFNTANGREFARLPLIESDEHKYFAARRYEPRQEPKALATALRLTLRRCYDDAKLIDQVSSLRSRAEQEGHRQTSRTSESWGKSVTAEVHDDGNLPDPYQEFHVRRYRNPDLNVRHRVLFALDPDTSSLTWLVYPLEDAWLDYHEASVELVGDMLRQAIEADVPIYRGVFSPLGPDGIHE